MGLEFRVPGFVVQPETSNSKPETWVMGGWKKENNWGCVQRLGPGVFLHGFGLGAKGLARWTRFFPLPGDAQLAAGV